MANQLAYGFIALEDMFARRVLEVGVEIIDTAITESTAEYSRQIQEIFSIWAEPSTVAKQVVILPGSGTLQSLDEFGVPIPVKDESKYEAGYPIRLGGDAWGVSRLTKKKMTVEEANRKTLASFRRDSDWLRRHMLAAVLTNTAYNFNDKELGTLQVVPLANNDSTPYFRDGVAVPSTDNHYFAQAAAIGDAANPFPTIYNALAEHPSNEGPFVVYVPSNLRNAIYALADFVEVADTELVLAANVNQLRNISDTELARIKGVGNEVLGRINKLWVVEWKALPDGYMVGVATGNPQPFMRMRQDEEPELQGFFRETFSSDGAREEYRFLRYAGFGVRDRTAAVVYQIGNASYQIPSAFQAPLP